MQQGRDSSASRRTCIVVMGPSGTGKTTVAKGLARALGWTFAEGDRFHPQANIDKMSAGVALDDDDRAPWLASIRDWIGAEAAAGRDTVLTCSALKRRYRDVLREAEARVRFVHLDAEPSLIAERIAARTGHYMPASLLSSQLAALEPLQSDEDAVEVDASTDAASVIATALRTLELRGGAEQP